MGDFSYLRYKQLPSRGLSRIGQLPPTTRDVPPSRPHTNIWRRLAVALFLFLRLSATLPRWWCGRDGHRWYDGDPDLVLAQAREIVAIVERGVAPQDFTAYGELF